MPLQFEHAIVIIQDAAAMADADVMNIEFQQFSVEVGLIFTIQGAGGFVELGEAGLANEQARKGQPLLFSRQKHMGPVQLSVESAHATRKVFEPPGFEGLPEPLA